MQDFPRNKSALHQRSVVDVKPSFHMVVNVSRHGRDTFTTIWKLGLSDISIVRVLKVAP